MTKKKKDFQSRNPNQTKQRMPAYSHCTTGKKTEKRKRKKTTKQHGGFHTFASHHQYRSHFPSWKIQCEEGKNGLKSGLRNGPFLLPSPLTPSRGEAKVPVVGKREGDKLIMQARRTLPSCGKQEGRGKMEMVEGGKEKGKRKAYT